MKTVASRKTHLDTIMISRNQGDDTFAAFQPMGIFHFWEDGEIHFFPTPLFFSVPTSNPVNFSVMKQK